jgi:hypothetical protein
MSSRVSSILKKKKQIQQIESSYTMPNCFSLTRKTDKDAGPVSLQQVDDEMRRHFKEPSDPGNWLWSWDNTIGLGLSLGRSFDHIIQECHTNLAQYPEDVGYYKRKLSIAEYLNDHFVSAAWAEIGK